MLQGDSILYLDTNPVVYLLPDRCHRLTVAKRNHRHNYINTKRLMSILQCDNTHKKCCQLSEEEAFIEANLQPKQIRVNGSSDFKIVRNTRRNEQRIKASIYLQIQTDWLLVNLYKTPQQVEGWIFTSQSPSCCWFSHVETLVHGGPLGVTSQLRDVRSRNKSKISPMWQPPNSLQLKWSVDSFCNRFIF